MTTDAQLLASYAATRSPEAFAAIVERHAGTVAASCVRLLGDAHAAEDALQAVFLILVRKAARLRPDTNLAGWLYLTAQAVARNVRKEEARRRRREREVSMRNAVEVGGADGGHWPEVRPHLDAAMARLPAVQREALVMRYLQGRSEAEICQELGCPQSTLSSRLTRGLERLRAFLAGRGVVVPAAALGGMLAAEAGPVAVPAALIAALKGIGAGAAATSVSGAAVSLAEGTMKAMTIGKLKLAAAVIGAVLVIGGGGGVLAWRLGATAGEPGSLAAPRAEPAPNAGKIEPALAPDPAVMAVITGLEDNSSALLPPIRTVGDWNEVTRKFGMQKTGPQGRNYCCKALWMPDRRRAFFCGANHGSPHRINDAWEYDLAANTWVLLFAPDPNNAEGVMEIREGEVRDGEGKVLEKVKYVATKRGGPTHYGHTWWAFCYHPGMKAALWMNVGIGSSFRQHIEKETGSKDGIYQGPAMWAFYPYEKKWELVLSPKPYPGVGYAKQMEYVPELGGALFMSGGWNGAGTWLYEHKANAWKRLCGKENAPDNESVTCHDPDRRLILALSDDRAGRATSHYDIAANRWEKVLVPGKGSTDNPQGYDARTPFFYDPGSKVALLFDGTTPEFMWSYSPPDKKWTRHGVQGPPAPAGKRIGYFDPERNVFVINCGDKTWVYRYRRAPGGK